MLILMIALFFPIKGFSVEAKLSPKEIVEIMMNNLDVSLPTTDDSGCKYNVNLPKKLKIRNYLTFLMSTFAEDQQMTSLQRFSAQCENPKGAPLKMPAKPDLFWDCEVIFNTTDKQSGETWNYGLVFRVAKKTKKMEKTPLACPGTP